MKLTRIRTRKSAVMGILTDDVGGIYFTLENAATLIPAGEYNVEINLSPRFKKKLPLVYNESVPASRGIRIHNGSNGYDSKGCILVGNTASLSAMSIGLSQAALKQLMGSCGTKLEIVSIE